MSQSERDEPNLAEVKAILGRLQRISRRPRAGGALTGEDDEPSSLQSDALAAMEGDGGARPAGMAGLMNTRRFVKAALVVVPVLVVVGGGVVMFAGGDRQPAAVKEPSPEAARQYAAKESASAPIVEAKPIEPTKPTVEAKATEQPKPAEEAKKPVPAEQTSSSVLQAASELLDSGRVREARTLLLRAMRDDSADVALVLAKSYDPNYLVTIRGAVDAAPDVEEAARWYRTWYDMAVKQGLVSDRVVLDRIIRSMN